MNSSIMHSTFIFFESETARLCHDEILYFFITLIFLCNIQVPNKLPFQPMDTKVVCPMDQTKAMRDMK